MSIAILAAAAFNLVCSGTQTTSSILGNEQKSYDFIYRVDLEGGKWCEADCKAVHDIVSLQPAMIKLEEKRVDSPSERSLLLNEINRETGAQTITSTFANPRRRAESISITYNGKCEKAAFSSFPKMETKF